jgi:hypothetical protein
MNIDFYLHTNWDSNFKQLALIPTVLITSSRHGKKGFTVLSISFLVWDFGISHFK